MNLLQTIIPLPIGGGAEYTYREATIILLGVALFSIILTAVASTFMSGDTYWERFKSCVIGLAISILFVGIWLLYSFILLLLLIF